MGFAALCQSWGAKIQPNELMPNFDPAPLKEISYGEWSELFGAYAKKHNARIGKSQRRKRPKPQQKPPKQTIPTPWQTHSAPDR